MLNQQVSKISILVEVVMAELLLVHQVNQAYVVYMHIVLILHCEVAICTKDCNLRTNINIGI